MGAMHPDAVAYFVLNSWTNWATVLLNHRGSIDEEALEHSTICLRAGYTLAEDR